MKITYGKNRKGKIVFDVSHKFAAGVTIADQCTMVTRRIIAKYPGAGNFEFYRKIGGDICGGRFSPVLERGQ